MKPLKVPVDGVFRTNPTRWYAVSNPYVDEGWVPTETAWVRTKQTE